MPLVTFALVEREGRPSIEPDPDGGSPARARFDVRPGGTLLRAARRARLPLGSSCRGVGVCTACRVPLVAGEENLSPREEIEDARLPRGERLACLARVYGPVTVVSEGW